MTVGGEGPRDFDRWFAAEWPRVVATVALATGDPELAADVAAEAFARALERWSRVGRMESPGGWTCRVALNLLRRSFRRRISEQRALGRAGPASDVMPREDAELWAVVRALPSRERTAVALRYGAGLTEPEIATAMGIAVGTVSATLNHARARLRRALDDSNVDVSNG